MTRCETEPSGWTCAHATIAGSSHRAEGSHHQDSHRVAELTDSLGQPVLVFAISDGAGTATRGAAGSELACDTLIDVATAHLTAHGTFASLDVDLLNRWTERCSDAIDERACHEGSDARSFACTLMFAIIQKDRAAFAQLGDGAMVFTTGATYTVACWPQSGEYVNTTRFLTDARDRAELMTRIADEKLTGVAAFTDGLQLLALTMADKQPYKPFFDTLLRSLTENRSLSSEFLNSLVAGFLASDPVQSRTDDDLTLVLALRNSPGNGEGSAVSATGVGG